VRTQRRKTGAHINNVIPAWLGKELLAAKNGNPTFFFISGEATPKGAVSTFDKMYRQVFKAAGIDGTSHMLRHTFSVELLKAGVDIRKVSRALGQLRDHPRTLLREVEQGATGHLGWGPCASVEEMNLTGEDRLDALVVA
jgi:Phage integrase family